MGEASKYRIQAVAEKTGVSAATLRAWERRYGIPSPRRTSSAYRLYTDEDIETIGELLRLREGGMSMAEAAARVRSESPVDPEPPEATPEQISDDPFVKVRHDMVGAVRRFDPMELERLLRSVSYSGGVSLVFERILAPVMLEIGNLWHAGEVSVGQEHMASFLLEGAMRNMLQMLQFPDHARTAVLGCAETEEHSLPVFGVAFQAAKWGFRPVMLGARTPASALKSAIRGVSPAFVGLSITVPPPPHQLRQMLEGYLASCDDVPLIFGGVGAVQLREEIISLGAQCPVDTSPEAFKAIVDSQALHFSS